ncbi:MAG: outer membrane beta-barrel protein [Tatlockia sp.]|nr:outer membrane beta-barrel protein [Tatlockia sp.]
MAIRKLGLVALGYLLSTASFAGSMGLDYTNFGNGWFVASISVGPGWARPGEDRGLLLQPDVLKLYIPDRRSRALRLIDTADGTRTLATGDFFIGLRGEINSAVEGQLGLSIGASSQVKLKGSVDEDANPLLNNFSYSYGVRNTRVALKAKFLYDMNFYDLFPYLSANVGMSYNHASGFSISPTIPEELPAPTFADNGQTELSYGMGVGLETSLDPSWRLGLGYEFLDWGKSALGPAFGQTGNTGLTIDHLRSHALLISVSYLA